MALVCLVIVGMLQVLLLKTAVSRRQLSREQAWRQQARWLAEAGIERAAARLAANVEYRGETWRLAAGELYAGQRPSEPASVEIEVQPAAAAGGERTVRVRAAYPHELPRRVLYEKQIKISLPLTGDP
jgi:hypothetical protein